MKSNNTWKAHQQGSVIFGFEKNPNLERDTNRFSAIRGRAPTEAQVR